MADTPKVPVAVLEYEPSGFEHTLLKHKTKLILVGMLAIASTGGYWGYRLIKEASHRTASVDFARAKSVSDLKLVAEKHSGKPSGGDALILAAERISTERPGEAIDMLKDFLNKYPDHPLRSLASFRIAEYYVLSGDNGSAEKEYDAVAKGNNAFSSLAQLRLGDMKWAAGDTTKAQEYYDTISKSASMSANAVRPIAKDRLESAIKSKPPVLVDYVPEPPPPAPGTPGIGAPGLDGINLNNLNGDPRDSGAPLLPPVAPPFDPNKLPAPGLSTPPVPAPGTQSPPPVPAPLPGTAPKPASPPPVSGIPPNPDPGKAIPRVPVHVPPQAPPGSAPKPGSTPPPASGDAPKAPPPPPASGTTPNPAPAPEAPPSGEKKVP